MSLLATVRNKQGKIVADLEQADFSLSENGHPQIIKYFSRETNLPLTLGLLVDTSGSQRRVLGEEKSASSQFINRVLREDKDRAFVIHFDLEIELLQDLTSSRKKLQAALDQLQVPAARQSGNGGGNGNPGGGGRGGAGGWPGGLGGGRPGGGGGRRSPGGGGGGPRRHAGSGTTLYDAVMLASDELMKKQSGRKALIVLSDGVDTGSKEPIATAIESAQRADTLIYSILFADEQAYAPLRGFGGDHPDGKKVLQRLSSETGASFLEVAPKQSITAIFDLIDDELRNQYSIGYTPSGKTNETGFRRIALTVNRKDLIVQTRDGYYGT